MATLPEYLGKPADTMAASCPSDYGLLVPRGPEEGINLHGSLLPPDFPHDLKDLLPHLLFKAAKPCAMP